jgi:hypothetical protein
MPGMDKRFFSSRKHPDWHLEPLPSLLFSWNHGLLLLRLKWLGMKLTTHLCSLLRLRMSVLHMYFPIHAFMMWSVTDLCSTVHAKMFTSNWDDNFKFFFVQLMHTNYIKMWIIKTFKIITVAPTCFSLYKPSSGSHKQYLAKITLMVQVYMLL